MEQVTNLIAITIGVMATFAIISIITKLYKAKKNDGVITPEELDEIGEALRKELTSLALKILNLQEKAKTNDPEAIKVYIDAQLKELVRSNVHLNEQEEELLNRMNAEDILKIADEIKAQKDKLKK